ncbi:MAG: hypothetical protein ABL929_11840, partial [Ferruginibacter sp.]
AKFRIFNLLGCICFIIYGFIFNAWPVILTNTILLFINIYYLNIYYKHIENFDLVEFDGDEKLIEKFLAFYGEDIRKYFPEFTIQQFKNNYNFIVLRDLGIANIFSANVSAKGDATVAINYTTKKYRDYKVSNFIFEKEKNNLIAKGVKRIIYSKIQINNFSTLLNRNGFKQIGDEYIKTL